MTASGQERELLLDGALDISSSAAEERSVPAVEAELPAMRANEVQDGAMTLVGCLPEAPAELLNEQRRTLRRPQHEHRVQHRDIDTFVEEIDREDHLHAASRQVAQRSFSIGSRAVTPHGYCRDAVSIEVLSHEACVLDAEAEPEAAHRTGVGEAVDLLHDEARPGVGTRVGGTQGVGVVPASPPPRDLAEIEPVVDPVVHERREVLLVDGIPQPKFGSDPVVEPLQDREAVASLRCRGQAEQLDRTNVIEQSLVGRRGCVVELVDDDHVEVIWCQVIEVAGVEALDRGEDVIEPPRSRSANPHLTEGRLPEGVAEGGGAGVEDLLGVSDEE